MKQRPHPIPSTRCIAGFLVFAFSATLHAAPALDAVEVSVEAMAGAAGAAVKARRSAVTHLVTFISTRPKQPIALKVPSLAPASERALAFMAAHGQAFGITTPTQVQVMRVTKKDEVGMEHVRLQQLHKGVPVTAGEMTVHLRGAGVVSVLAKTLSSLDKIDTVPRITATEAAAAVKNLLAKKRGITDAVLSTPRLEILNKGLLQGLGGPSRLAWFIEATKIDLREYVWVDAANGLSILAFSQLTDARNRRIFDANNGNVLPGILVRSELAPPTGDPDADAAFDFSGDTYDYFFNEHGRDSFDGAGATLVSTVHFCPDPAFCPFANAFWDGKQMVYGEGFSAADDVDAHELTHAVTEFSAKLFYYAQSGALNESFSDIFGETVDLTNVAGTDTPAVRWLLGEDVPGFGAFRNMMDPTAFGDPGKVTDPEFKCDTNDGDGGGVHSNSGVPNHAYALMVDGGTYNSQTVSGIGDIKAGAIQYRVLTNYLTSGSNFVDNYQALQQSCTDLIGGPAGITAADCTEVLKALDAVEMSQGVCSQPNEAALCPAGETPIYLFADGLEAGRGNFVFQTLAGINIWSLQAFFARTGTFHLDAFDQFALATDSSAAMNRGVLIPAGVTRMQVSHAYDFEVFAGTTFDGGVLEYSTDGGTTWTDAGSLISAGNVYNGTIDAGSDNPLGGRPAFVSNSLGYTATQLDISSLLGSAVRFRFRVGTDSLGPSFGWDIDDIRIYQCVAVLPVPNDCHGRTPTLLGTDGNDILNGTTGRDVIVGLAGNDRINGGGGKDIICGADGRDTIFGGKGKDTLYGGAGNDKLDGGRGFDRLRGGPGRDTCVRGESLRSCP